MNLAIQLDRVTKRYRTGRSRTIVDLVASNLDRARGKRDEVHSASRGQIDATIYAMRDVSIEIAEGAGLGVIGRNGAGKTTLLKLISRVTWPTSGTVRVAGHVVSLIELGAGFHPELTGRENVYLGAGLFGLTRHEIGRRFDAIVDFADVARLIDTPMKRYSSGLYARTRPSSIQRMSLQSRRTFHMSCEMNRIVFPSAISRRSASSARRRNAASPTASTSSTRTISGLLKMATAKPSRA